MEKITLTEQEMDSIVTGEAITLAGVMAILVIAVIAVVVYKLFLSGDGKVSLPGGYKFEWD